MNAEELRVGDVVDVKFSPPGPGTRDYWERHGITFHGVEVTKVDERCNTVDLRFVIEDEEMLDMWNDACGDDFGNHVGEVIDLPDGNADEILRIVRQGSSTYDVEAILDELVEQVVGRVYERHEPGSVSEEEFAQRARVVRSRVEAAVAEHVRIER